MGPSCWCGRLEKENIDSQMNTQFTSIFFWGFVDVLCTCQSESWDGAPPGHPHDYDILTFQMVKNGL